MSTPSPDLLRKMHAGWRAANYRGPDERKTPPLPRWQA